MAAACRPKLLLLHRQTRSLHPAGCALRTVMSAAAARKHEFLVIVPDKPGMHAKRLEVRPLHLSNMAPHIESGKWKMGGALLKTLPADDDPSTFDFAGSTIVCLAESRDEVLKQLREDIYTTTGVWDTENAQIYPFKCAFRNP